MARIRSIKPEFFLHEDLADLSALHRLLFIGLWTLADRRGRLEDRPKRIKAALLPWEDCDLDALLVDLHNGGFIVRYEAGGHACIYIPGFEKHQKPHPKENTYDLPDPSPDVFGREISRQAVKENGKPEKGEYEQRGILCMENGELTPVNGPPEPRPPPAKPAPVRVVGGLRDGLDAIFLKAKGAPFQWTTRDEQAIRSLLAHPEAEVLRRWEIALGTNFPRCTGVHSLVESWNAYAAAPPTTGAGPPKNTLRRGVARAEDADHSKNRVVDDDGTIEL